MQLLCREEIKRSIRKMIPRKIAVGYVGSRWQQYIESADKLQSFVVSPRLGTNVAAVREIAKQCTWEKVWLHNNLHAKIYIGKGKAVLTSANLSENALEPGGLIEVGAVVDNRIMLDGIEAFFETILAEAKKQYPTRGEKEARLKRLEAENKARIKPALPIEKTPRGVQYEPVWWTDDDDFEVNAAKFTDWVPEATVKAGPAAVEDWICEQYAVFSCEHGDSYHPGDWLLAFELDVKTQSHVKQLTWHCVEAVVPGASREKGYPDAVLCTEEEKTSRRVPFRINEKLLDAFRNVLKRPKYKHMCTYRRYDELHPNLLRDFDRDLRSEVLKLGKK